MVFAGHLDVYSRGSELIEKFLRVSSDPAQIFRVTNHHAERLAPVLYEPSPALQLDDEEVVYAQIDGSMIFTDNKWREVKLGRVLASGDVEEAGNASRGATVRQSEYAGHLGGVEEFTAKFAPIVAKYAPLGERLVFVVDGALWIRNWIDETFAEATQRRSRRRRRSSTSTMRPSTPGSSPEPPSPTPISGSGGWRSRRRCCWPGRSSVSSPTFVGSPDPQVR